MSAGANLALWSLSACLPLSLPSPCSPSIARFFFLPLSLLACSWLTGSQLSSTPSPSPTACLQSPGDSIESQPTSTNLISIAQAEAESGLGGCCRFLKRQLARFPVAAATTLHLVLSPFHPSPETLPDASLHFSAPLCLITIINSPLSNHCISRNLQCNIFKCILLKRSKFTYFSHLKIETINFTVTVCICPFWWIFQILYYCPPSELKPLWVVA